MIRGSHTLKFGLNGEYDQNSEGPNSNFGGSIDFSRNINNPLDSNYAYFECYSWRILELFRIEFQDHGPI